jgi:hypothetical protein
MFPTIISHYLLSLLLCSFDSHRVTERGYGAGVVERKFAGRNLRVYIFKKRQNSRVIFRWWVTNYFFIIYSFLAGGWFRIEVNGRIFLFRQTKNGATQKSIYSCSTYCKIQNIYVYVYVYEWRDALLTFSPLSDGK